jgi:hypothetical protein
LSSLGARVCSSSRAEQDQDHDVVDGVGAGNDAEAAEHVDGAEVAARGGEEEQLGPVAVPPVGSEVSW